MKSILLVFVSILFPLYVFSAPAQSSFTCTVDKYPGAAFTFVVTALGKDNVSLVGSEKESAFSSNTNDVDIKLLVELFNSADTNIEMIDQGLKIFGDMDGCDTAKFVLYADSGFTRGYIDVKHSCSDDEPWYSKVHCTVK